MNTPCKGEDKVAKNTKLFVGNLSHKMDNNELKEAFQPYGEVVSAQIITDKETRRSKGFGFVEMEDASQAEAAIKALHGTEVAGRTITVDEARDRPPKPAHKKPFRHPRKFD